MLQDLQIFDKLFGESSMVMRRFYCHNDVKTISFSLKDKPFSILTVKTVLE